MTMRQRTKATAQPTRNTSRARAASLVGATLVAALSVSACTPLSIGQRNWEGRLDRADGVIDASWRYQHNWPSSGPKYSGFVDLAPHLTDDEARDIARLSCDGGPRFDELYFSAEAEDGRWSASKYGLETSCFDEEELVRFALVLAALDTTGADVMGEAVVFSDHAARPTLNMNLETTSTENLFSVLREIDARNPDAALDIQAWVDDDGSTITNFGEVITIETPTGYRLSEALPMLEQAYRLPHRSVTFAPDGLTIWAATPQALTSPETAAVRASADRLNVTVYLRLAIPTHLNPDEAAAEEQLILALHELDRVTEVSLGSISSTGGINVTARDRAGLADALEVIASHGQSGSEIYLETAAHDPFFVRISRHSAPVAGVNEAYAHMLTALENIPHAEYAALIVEPEQIRMRFDLDAGASASAVQQAKDQLHQLIEQTSINEVSFSSAHGHETLAAE